MEIFFFWQEKLYNEYLSQSVADHDLLWPSPNLISRQLVSEYKSRDLPAPRRKPAWGDAEAPTPESSEFTYPLLLF